MIKVDTSSLTLVERVALEQAAEFAGSGSVESHAAAYVQRWVDALVEGFVSAVVPELRPVAKTFLDTAEEAVRARAGWGEEPPAEETAGAV